MKNAVLLLILALGVVACKTPQVVPVQPVAASADVFGPVVFRVVDSVSGKPFAPTATAWVWAFRAAYQDNKILDELNTNPLDLPGRTLQQLLLFKPMGIYQPATGTIVLNFEYLPNIKPDSLVKVAFQWDFQGGRQKRRQYTYLGLRDGKAKDIVVKVNRQRLGI